MSSNRFFSDNPITQTTSNIPTTTTTTTNSACITVTTSTTAIDDASGMSLSLIPGEQPCRITFYGQLVPKKQFLDNSDFLIRLYSDFRDPMMLSKLQELTFGSSPSIITGRNGATIGYEFNFYWITPDQENQLIDSFEKVLSQITPIKAYCRTNRDKDLDPSIRANYAQYRFDGLSLEMKTEIFWQLCELIDQYKKDLPRSYTEQFRPVKTSCTP